MVKIYTRTGDKGETSLFGGKRVVKSSGRVDTYGTVDELNSVIGVAVAHLKSSEKVVRKQLEIIQHDLLNIGSYLASPGVKTQEVRVTTLPKRVTELEVFIDELTVKLPELRNFILPGGGKAGAFLHQARTVCRRTERRLVALANTEEVSDSVLQYFNRLSDALFTTARFVNHKEKKKETIWSSES